MKINSTIILGVFFIANLATFAIAGAEFKGNGINIEPSLPVNFQGMGGVFGENAAILNSICHVTGGGMSLDPEQPIRMICLDQDGNQIN